MLLLLRLKEADDALLPFGSLVRPVGPGTNPPHLYAAGGTRTRTGGTSQQILSLLRLPFRHGGLRGREGYASSRGLGSVNLAITVAACVWSQKSLTELEFGCFADSILVA